MDETPKGAAAPGPVVLFGGGETTAPAGAVFEAVLRESCGGEPPRIAVLETPAGFEPNSALVAERVAAFLRRRLAPLGAAVEVVPARRRGTAASPDDPALLPAILRSHAVFLGPGSPTYAARQLRGSLAWHAVTARHRLGGVTILASAAMVAAGVEALPVYEIYKVGEELHWKEGLDLLGPWGLPLVLVPHWNNRDGGPELDTRRCYLGEERFAALLPLLPPGRTVVGVDEGTALVVDPRAGTARVTGRGGVTVLREGEERRLAAPAELPLPTLGPFRPSPGRGAVPEAVWREALDALPPSGGTALPPPALPPAEVRRLLEMREEARSRKEWVAADALRRQILLAGWAVSDGPSGPVAVPAGPGAPPREPGAVG